MAVAADEEGGGAAAAERAALLKSAERKLSKRILPCLSLLSIICYLDRANLAFASSAMNADLGFSTATYGLGSGLFFIGYALFQVPSNMVMARLGGPLWLSAICIAWGTVAACFAAINSRGSFLALRMLLGIAEAGALPGMWLYTSQFYLPHRLTIPMVPGCGQRLRRVRVALGWRVWEEKSAAIGSKSKIQDKAGSLQGSVEQVRMGAPGREHGCVGDEGLQLAATTGYRIREGAVPATQSGYRGRQCRGDRIQDKRGCCSSNPEWVQGAAVQRLGAQGVQAPTGLDAPAAGHSAGKNQDAGYRGWYKVVLLLLRRRRRRQRIRLKHHTQRVGQVGGQRAQAILAHRALQHLHRSPRRGLGLLLLPLPGLGGKLRLGEVAAGAAGVLVIGAQHGGDAGRRATQLLADLFKGHALIDAQRASAHDLLARPLHWCLARCRARRLLRRLASGRGRGGAGRGTAGAGAAAGRAGPLQAGLGRHRRLHQRGQRAGRRRAGCAVGGDVRRRQLCRLRVKGCHQQAALQLLLVGIVPLAQLGDAAQLPVGLALGRRAAGGQAPRVQPDGIEVHQLVVQEALHSGLGGAVLESRGVLARAYLYVAGQGLGSRVKGRRPPLVLVRQSRVLGAVELVRHQQPLGGEEAQQQALQLREAVAGHQLAWAKAVVEHDGLSAAAAVAGAGRCRRRCPARRLSWPREQGAALSGQVALHQRQARRRQHGQPCAVRQRELPHHLGVAVRLEAQGSRRIAHPARQPAAGAWSTVTTEVREKLGIGGKVYRDWFIQPHTAPLMRKKQYRSGLAWQIGRSSSALQRQPSAPMQHPCTYTLVMAGITVAQVLGAPLATGFLAMHGAGGLAGWRWLFLLEGIPSVLLGLNLWWLLPGSIASARCLSADERQALEEEMAKHQPQLRPEANETSTASGKEVSTPTEPEKNATGGCWGRCKCYTPQRAQRRSLADDWAAMKVALRCPIVYCSGVWRCLYAMAVYGLQYFTPLIIKDMLGQSASTTEVTLLSAIPYGAAAVFHIANALHSQYTGERRWHIALPWLVGGIFMAVLPTVTDSGKHAAAMAILTLASIGVNGADGPDVAWITTLQTAEERLLGLPTINMIANVGGFVGPYIIGALNTASGNYNASEWVMAGCILAASLMVMAFPLRWASVQPQQAQQLQAEQAAAAEEGEAARAQEGGSEHPARLFSRSTSRLWAAAMCVAGGEQMLMCPEAIRSQVLPELEPSPSQLRPHLRAHSMGSVLRQRVLAGSGGGSSSMELQRAGTAAF